MLIGGRTRGIHEAKKLWQGDIEKRSGLLPRISPGLRMATPYRLFETLEKLARALEVSLYQLFYEGEEPPRLPHLPKRLTEDRTTWGSTGKQARVLSKFRRLLARMHKSDGRLSTFTGPASPIPSGIGFQWSATAQEWKFLSSGRLTPGVSD